MRINCKKKGCNNEVLNGNKYCNYHQSKKEEIKKTIVKSSGTIAAFTIAVALKIKNIKRR